MPVLFQTLFYNASFTLSATSSDTHWVQISSFSFIHHIAASSLDASFSSIYFNASSVNSLIVSYFSKNYTTSGACSRTSLCTPTTTSFGGNDEPLFSSHTNYSNGSTSNKIKSYLTVTAIGAEKYTTQ